MEPDLELLLARAERAFGGRDPKEIIPKVRAIVAPWRIPDSAGTAASAMTKLKKGQKPTALELSALEYVIRMMRPAPLVQDGVPEDLPEEGDALHPEGTLERWKRFRSAAPNLLESVCRIDHVDFGHVGTGFLVGQGLLATNRHVLDVFSYGFNVLPEDPGVTLYFKGELDKGDPKETRGRVLGVKAVHDTMDIALLAVEVNSARPALTLDPDLKPDIGHPVVVPGYPAKNDISNPLFAGAIFNDRFGVKRAAMGEVIKAAGERIFHDCTTLGGNSGSPVISLESHRVIGIHAGGTFAYRNEAYQAKGIQELLTT